MSTKELKELESYFKTKNDHWNSHSFELLCEVLKLGNFEKPETALKLYSDGLDIIIKQHATPLQAVENAVSLIDGKELKPKQKLFILEKVLNYLRNSEFDNADTTEIKPLLKSKIGRLKTEIENTKPERPEYTKPLVSNIRNTLKELMQKEVEQLSETLSSLDPVQRINILCKLIPYVLPKVEAVHSEKGEQKKESNWKLF